MGATTGERQIGITLDDIAKNHVARYEWAARLLQRELPKGSRILDAACGCAYGSLILAKAGFKVFSYDRSDEAAEYSKNYKHPFVKFHQGDIFEALTSSYDAAVSIETIEHIDRDRDWVNGLYKSTPLVVGTVPNQDVVAFDPKSHQFHERHYTKAEISDLFGQWALSDWSTQYGKWENFEMRPGEDGMTLGFLAKRPV